MDTPWFWFGSGAIVGMLLAAAHLALLRHALGRSQGLSADQAKRQVVRGMWLRIGMWIPALLAAVFAGLWACLGIVFGSLLGRWLIIWRSKAT